MAPTQACIHAPYFLGTPLPHIHTHLPETFRENADHGTQDNLHSQTLHLSRVCTWKWGEVEPCPRGPLISDR